MKNTEQPGVLSPAAESLMQAAAEKIAAHGMEAPALFLLEMNKPITTVLHTAALVIEPLTGAFFGFGVTRAATELLSCRDNFDRLARAIEDRSKQSAARPGGS